jgi:polysaccharide pyruvyl transferase WcaK-like protein
VDSASNKNVEWIVSNQKIFVSLTGQDDNLGDSVLRREMIQAIRPSGSSIHAHVGDNSQNYIEGLGLSAGDKIYRSRLAWYKDIVTCRPRKLTIALNPGERNLAPGESYFGTYQGAIFRGMARLGARVVQAGVGIRTPECIDPEYLASQLKIIDLVSWRDQASRDAIGVGLVHPDWALHNRGLRNYRTRSERPLLAVALRGDRPAPPRKWVDQLREVCAAADLEPVLVVQVARDQERAHELAAAIARSAKVIEWSDGTHRDQEAVIREVYSKSAAVISDRLHALILGVTEGAVPIAWSPNSTEKCVRTLTSSGFENPAPLTGDSAVQSVLRMIANSEGTVTALEQAQLELANLSQSIRNLSVANR